MATTDELASIVRGLNKVESAAQARAAMGAALRALSKAYELLPRLERDLRGRSQRELDGARTDLELAYRTAKAPDRTSVRNDWGKLRLKVQRAYVVIAGVEGAASYIPRTSNLDILVTSIAEAPGVFADKVGQAAGTVTNKAGEAAGGVLKGLGKGIGLSGLLLVGALVLVLVVVKKGLPLPILKLGGA